MNITIIGAGNGGQAMAGHFTLLGHRITLYNRSINRNRNISVTKEIVLEEAIKGKAKIHKFTHDIKEAIKGAELIMITTTADAHKELANKMASLLEDGQCVVLNPGRTLGALEFAREVRRNTDKRLFIAEAQSLIYASRADADGNVRIIGVKNKVLLSAYPASDTVKILDMLNSIYPCFIKGDNILHTGLENIGAILHPAVIMLNAAAIERGTLFYFYNDMTPAVANFLENLDNERLLLGKAFNITLLSLKDWISYAYGNVTGVTLLEKIKNNPAYYKIIAPNSIYCRLMFEDVPTGILPMVELGKIANVNTPLMTSILNISQTLLGLNFINSGRTLRNLGIDNISLDDFIRHL